MYKMYKLMAIKHDKIQYMLASRSTHYRSFRRRSSRQSLALVRTTKINSKINQTKQKTQNTI